MHRRNFIAAGSLGFLLKSNLSSAQVTSTDRAQGSAFIAGAATADRNQTGITRHMVTIGRRQVHYRRAGSGPPVLMLHSSPSSSRVFNVHLERLKDRFTLFALDTPGNGLSDVLEDTSPDISLYSHNIMQVMDALGLERCALLGGYTGGIITLDASARFPERIPVAVLHGYLQLTETERQDFLQNYLIPVIPDPFGAYLVATWAHSRDGGLFFPWYRQNAEHRRVAGVPSPAAITRSVIDTLRAGDAIRFPYRAALSTRTEEALMKVRNKLTITMSPQDEMWPHRLRMPTLPPSVMFSPGTSTSECVGIWDRALLADKVDSKVPSPRPAAAIAGAIWSDVVQLGEVNVFVRRNDEVRSRPLLFLHDTDASSRSSERWMRPFIGRRTLFAPDMPGRGETELPRSMDIGIAAQAAVLAALMKHQRFESADIVAFGFSATLAVELATQFRRLVNRIAMIDTRFPVPASLSEYAAQYAPPITLDPYGSHLTTVWNQVRDRQLFTPWFKQDESTVIQGESLDLSPDILDMRTVDVLKSLEHRSRLFADVFAYPFYDRLPLVGVPLLLVRPGRDLAAIAKSRLDSISVAEMPELSPTAAATRLESFFEDRS